MEPSGKGVHDRRRGTDTGPPYGIRHNEEDYTMESLARHVRRRYRPPFPDIVDSVPPAVLVETDEENTDPPYDILHNEDDRYEPFEEYSYAFLEAPTDLSAFMAGVKFRENPVRLRSTSRRPDG